MPTRALLAAVVVLALAACNEDAPAPAPRPSSASPAAAPTSAAPSAAPVDPLSPQPAVESSAPAPGRSTPTCRAADLSVADADLLADEQALREVFAIRTGGRTCALQGFPVVQLLDARGGSLEATTTRSGTATRVALTRSTSLSFVLSTPRSGDCAQAATLVVRLPGTDRDLRVATEAQVCGGRLQVGPVERRTDDE